MGENLKKWVCKTAPKQDFEGYAIDYNYNINGGNMRKNNKLYYITVFLCGVCIMGIELSASRLLWPFFVFTNLVWILIIWMIMIGTGFGNYIGGKLADKHQDIGVLYKYLLLCGLWVIVLPFFKKIIITISMIIGSIIPVNNTCIAHTICGSFQC